MGQLGGCFTVEAGDHEITGKRRGGRGGEVEHCDKQQRPECTPSGRLNRFHGVEAHNDVGESGGADHQGQRDKKDVPFIPDADKGFGVTGKAEVGMDLVEFVEQEDAGLTVYAFGKRRTEAGLGNGVAGEHDADRDGGHKVGGDEHPILGDLGPGDAFHAAEGGVDEDNGHADDHADIDVDFEESAEDHSDSAHLSGYVGETDKDGADNGHQARGAGAVAVANKIRHGVVSEFAEIRREQEGEQYVATGPAHQIHAAGITHRRNQASH